MKKYNVAVVGVGEVGFEMLRCLKQRRFPIGELRVFARSARDIEVDGQIYSVKAISAEGFEGIDIALFAGTEGEKGAAVTFASEAVKRGAIVIDNGADFRMEDDVPLVVPEINAQDIKERKRGIIANPNCSTIQMVVALWPIYKEAGIKRVIVCSYQAVSGAGRGGIVQLEGELEKAFFEKMNSKGSLSNIERAFYDAQSPKKLDILERAFAYSIGKNAIPQIGSFGDFDYTSEEWKMVRETHKIMHDDKIKISATCVRVPVRTGHAEAVYIETKKPIEPDKARSILVESAGIKVIDEPKNNLYPQPKDAEGKDEVFVGRIRKDPFVKNGLWLWIVSDNLRKGAALNAIQIAEELIK